MARLLTPTVLRRGFEIFALGSLVSFLVLLFYSNNTSAFLAAIPRIRWGGCCWAPGWPRSTGSAAGSGTGCWRG
ncbi:MAG: hypothetical protein R2909_16840 [Gemmatimonadales bacterium]